MKVVALRLAVLVVSNSGEASRAVLGGHVAWLSKMKWYGMPIQNVHGINFSHVPNSGSDRLIFEALTLVPRECAWIIIAVSKA
jgi:hypothetical protein